MMLILNFPSAKLHATYQDVVNISDPLSLKDSENKSDVLSQLNGDTVPAWRIGTTLIVGDSYYLVLRNVTKKLEKC